MFDIGLKGGSAFTALEATMDWVCGRQVRGCRCCAPTGHGASRLSQVYPKQHGPYSVRANPAEPVWTNAGVGANALLDIPFPGCDTIYATFQYAVGKNGNRPAVGTRPLLKARPQPRGTAALSWRSISVTSLRRAALPPPSRRPACGSAAARRARWPETRGCRGG